MHRLYWIALPPLLASLASLGRWLLQGSHNVYTDFGKDFYVPDRDLGWRLTHSSATWLGLDALLLAVGIFLAMLVAVSLLHRWEVKAGRQRKAVRGALAGVSAAALLLPAWAFLTGFGPAGARETLPEQNLVVVPEGGMHGKLPTLPPGSYELQSHEGTQITASVKAGGESFEARFAGDPQGFLRLDPSDLSQPVSASFSVASNSVDTGIELRSKHARDELQSDLHPRLAFVLSRVLSSAQDGDRGLSFAAEGDLSLAGGSIPVQVLGTLTAPDGEARKRLGFASDAVLLVKASLTLSLDASPIKNDGSFDENSIPIQVSLLMVRKQSK